MNHEFSTHRGEERIINGTGEQWDREAHLEQHKDKEKLVLSSQVERLGRLWGLKFQDKAQKKLPGAWYNNLKKYFSPSDSEWTLVYSNFSPDQFISCLNNSREIVTNSNSSRRYILRTYHYLSTRPIHCLELWILQEGGKCSWDWESKYWVVVLVVFLAKSCPYFWPWCIISKWGNLITWPLPTNHLKYLTPNCAE